MSSSATVGRRGSVFNDVICVSDHAGVHRRSEELVQGRDAETGLAADRGTKEDLRDHLRNTRTNG